MICINNLNKDYNKQNVLKNLNLEVKDHEFIVILGPSGCGKTTLLKLIAGLEDNYEGSIFIDGNDMKKVEPKDRNIAMVFQNYALFPDMTVYQNIAFGLQIRKVRKDVIDNIVNKISVKLKIDILLKRKPSQLSGGEQQRVAIARAMVKNPSIYLFDEPLSNLDVNLKSEFIQLIKDIHNETKGTFIYVTHAQNEALVLADRVVVMNDGEILQIDKPINLYKKPNCEFVAKFIGDPKINIIEINKYHIGVRPENIKIGKVKNSLIINTTVESSEFLGNGYILNVNYESSILKVFTLIPYLDKNIVLSINKKDLIFFQNESVIDIELDKIRCINNIIVVEK